MGRAGQSLVQTCCGATLTTARSLVIPSRLRVFVLHLCMKTIYTLSDLRDWKKKTRDISPPIRLGVLGDPVAHSLSPEMQNAALQECGIALQYAPFQIAPDELETAIRLLRELDFVGLNLTVPHKIAALSFVDEVEERARKIGAINTIVFRDGQFVRLEYRRARVRAGHSGGILRRSARFARPPARSGWGSGSRSRLPMRLGKLRASRARESHFRQGAGAGARTGGLF